MSKHNCVSTAESVCQNTTPPASTEVSTSNEERRKTEISQKIVWPNVARFVYVHLGALYGLYIVVTEARFAEALFSFIYGTCGLIGITAGAHRLWSHRAYRATWQLRLILAIFQTMAFQNSIFDWARDHRVHHKFSETDADPHNAKRGFFFSHIGWLMMKKHPDIIDKGKAVDLSDLKRDFFVKWQRKLYYLVMPILAFVIPTWSLMYFWDCTLWKAWNISLLRWVWSLHATWLVNSAAHLWGHRPYDKNINPAENIGVSILAIGEGWHNYHHVFPYDYKTAEFGLFNPTKMFIDFFALIGWAYDLKTVSQDSIKKRILRTGDGTHKYSSMNGSVPQDKHPTVLWGWGDKDLKKEDCDIVKTINKSKEE